MKIPIPNDWDGQTWTCYQVRWPSSVSWQAILAGLISQTARGTMYDVQTGWIPDAQAVGREILRRNWPWRDCAGLLQQPTQADLLALGGCLDCEEWDMACIDISGMLKMEGGVLYARDSCCEWVAIGTFSQAPQDLGSEPLDPTGELGPVYYACGKADAIMSVIEKVITGFWNQQDEAPWSWIPNIEGYVGFDLDNKWLLAGVADVSVLTGTLFDFQLLDVLDPFRLQEMRCKLEAFFADDATGVPDSSTFDAIKGIIISESGAFTTQYTAAINAIGRADLDNIAKMGAGTDADCACPDPGYLQSYGPDGAGWYLSTPITEGQLTNTNTEAANLAVCFEQTPSHDVYGVAYKLTWAGLAAGAHLKKMGSTYSPSCAPTDAWCWGDSSDHLQEAAANTWLMVANGQTIKDAISALLAGQAVSQIYSDSSFFSSVIATPGSGAAGQDLAGVFVLPTVATGGTLTITEIRWVQNTNSPSHA